MSAVGALVAAQPDLQRGGAPTERDMRQFPDHAVPREAVAAAAVAPVVGLDRATQQDRALAGEVLTGDGQAEVIETAERGQVRGREGSVVHVEVFGDGCVGTSIIQGPRSLSPPGSRYRTTPSIVKRFPNGLSSLQRVDFGAW